MTRDEHSKIEQQLQAYQDGLLNETDRAVFERLLRERPEVVAAIELQSEVDDSLRRLFQPPPPLDDVVSKDGPLSHVNGVPRLRTRRSAGWVAALATVAAVAWAIVAWQLQFGGDSNDEPFFEPRPLVEIYHETIARGFKPYYECRDDERFAFTFELRQGRRLRLAQLPAGRQMLGLSYSGGISRDTTAMLCTVDGRPVIVFVDRLDADRPQSVDNEVNIVRREYAGLVLYEVTPHPEQRILDFLVVP